MCIYSNRLFRTCLVDSVEKYKRLRNKVASDAGSRDNKQYRGLTIIAVKVQVKYAACVA